MILGWKAYCKLFVNYKKIQTLRFKICGVGMSHCSDEDVARSKALLRKMMVKLPVEIN